MKPVCQDLLVLQDKSGNRFDHWRQRFRGETRVTQEFRAPEVIQAIQDLLVPLVAKKETRENREKQANEANQAKMATLVLQAFLESKENQAFQVLLAGMGREDSKVIVDTQAHQDR